MEGLFQQGIDEAGGERAPVDQSGVGLQPLIGRPGSGMESDTEAGLGMGEGWQKYLNGAC